MRQTLTLELDDELCGELGRLAQSLGFSMEAAAEYAVRMICACVREGLIADVPPRAWPRDAQLLTGTGGKVLSFPQPARQNQE